jgi:hypothetical protein
MTTIYAELESKRCDLQQELDSEKTQPDRNKLGQFATPPALAQDIIDFGLSLLPKKKDIRFLDPAFGSGSFYSALRARHPGNPVQEAAGFEIDAHYGTPAARLWKNSGLDLKLADFTKAKPTPRFNFLICNPPYVRHHHLTSDEKLRLQEASARSSGVEMSGLAGLYCHFLMLSHQWMEKGAVAGWLIPSEFMDVNYGVAIKRYLLDCVTLLRIHRFDPNDVQFSDALVSSAIVWFRNEPAPKKHEIDFSFGGRLLKPKITRSISATALSHEPKWTRFPLSAVRPKSTAPKLSDFFKIKRGLATGNNNFFILSAQEIEERRLPFELFRPILPSPRYLKADQVDADKNGNPKLLKKLFLLDTKMSEDEIRLRFPTLSKYLEEGKSRGVHEGFLCSHRSPWYSQEDRPPAPVVCTYIGRSDTPSGKPFRFIRNHSQATVANVFLAMYPTPLLALAMQKDGQLIDKIWKILNAIDPAKLLSEGRVYGGGLHKLEPKELGNLPIEEDSILLYAQ